MEKLWKIAVKQSQEHVSSGMWIEINKTFGLSNTNHKEIKDVVHSIYGISSPLSNISTLFSTKKL